MDKNYIMRGDNSPAMELLLSRGYGGKVKCIFIDPPYNTGQSFEQYSDNRGHDEWLSFMQARVKLMRELLSEDGSLWIAINDEIAHYLKIACDAVFGRKNYVTTVIWRKNYSPKSSGKWLSVDHDHILIYAKNKEVWRPNLVPRNDAQLKDYRNPDDDPRGPWKRGDLSAPAVYSKGLYAITTPSGRIIEGPPNKNYWRVSEEKFLEMKEDGRISFGKNGDAIPVIKRFLSEVKDGVTPQTFWDYSEVGHTQEAKQESLKLFDGDSFATPKPERLLRRVLTIASNEGDLILDAFAGSGTTGAVAHKMGRPWVMIESGEHCLTHVARRMDGLSAPYTFLDLKESSE
jgi:adenine-specific DNA-methyltransferase